jgi:hypothetical protein
MCKLLLAIVFLIAASLPGLAAVTFVQQAAATNGAGDVTATFGVSVQQGNSVILCVSYPSADTLLTVNLVSSGEAFTLLRSKTQGAIKVNLYYQLRVQSSGNTAVRVTTNGTRININASEWSGLAPQGVGGQPPYYAEDGETGGNLGTSAPSPSANTTGLRYGWLLVTVLTFEENAYSSGPTNGFTRMTPTGGGAVWQESGYLVSTDPGIYTTHWTLTGTLDYVYATGYFEPFVPNTGVFVDPNL